MNLREAARMMAEQDCGCLPIVEDNGSRKLRGVITDRDIACRAVANGMDPETTSVMEVMTPEVATVKPDTPMSKVEELMKERQVRRVPVVTDEGSCCGMIAQADVARTMPDQQVGRVVRNISLPYIA
jgi:CBS domain-containing protein